MSVLPPSPLLPSHPLGGSRVLLYFHAHVFTCTEAGATVSSRSVSTLAPRHGRLSPSLSLTAGLPTPTLWRNPFSHSLRCFFLLCPRRSLPLDASTHPRFRSPFCLNPFLLLYNEGSCPRFPSRRNPHTHTHPFIRTPTIIPIPPKAIVACLRAPPDSCITKEGYAHASHHNRRHTHTFHRHTPHHPRFRRHTHEFPHTPRLMPPPPSQQGPCLHNPLAQPHPSRTQADTYIPNAFNRHTHTHRAPIGSPPLTIQEGLSHASPSALGGTKPTLTFRSRKAPRPCIPSCSRRAPRP